MQITHLLRYICKDESQPCVLKDCSVVIDAPNFLYSMYRESGLPFAFGCESDKFATYMKQRLNMFKDANVKCYFVFRGGFTNLIRIDCELDQAKEDFVPPVIIKDVHKQVLAELGIPFAVCELECKRDCVVLAEQLKCAVISYDTEFVLMKAPYIPYKEYSGKNRDGTIKYEPALEYNPEMRQIECRQYKREDFLNRHLLTEQKFAIFAVLNDKDRFEDGVFDNLFKWLRALQTYFTKRYTILWKWLSKCEATVALHIINEFLSENDREKFAKEMNGVMDLMQVKQQSFVADYLLNGCILDFVPAEYPNWFEKGVVTKKIAIPFINLYRDDCMLRLDAAVEDQHSHSMLLSMDIVKYAYNLMTNFERNKFTLLTGLEEVEVPNNLAAAAQDAIQTPAFVNGWNDIKELRLFEKFLNENSISAALVAQAPGAAAVLLAALVYFARRKAADDVAVQREVYSVIACFVMLADNRDIPTEDRDEAVKATPAYFAVSKRETEKIFDEKLSHDFVEFQQCLILLNYLNALCGSPFAPTVYHRAYNGTFVYKLVHKMARDGDDCATFIDKLFNRSPSVLNYINKLIGLYNTMK